MGQFCLLVQAIPKVGSAIRKTALTARNIVKHTTTDAKSKKLFLYYILVYGVRGLSKIY